MKAERRTTARAGRVGPARAVHRPPRRPPLPGAIPTLVLATLFGCGPADAGDTLEIYAASSLTEAFRELERAFEASYPGTDVLVTFAGSQVLRVQIEQGAEADIFASANPEHMRSLVEAGLVGEARVFAHNELVVIVPAENPAGIEAFRDLPRASRLVIGTENVPVGRYTREIIAGATPSLGVDFEDQVLSRVVSEESNVRLVRAKVELGEADAAVVYRTDAADGEGLRLVPIPSEHNVRADYPIGIVRGSKRSAAARLWVDFVTSDTGRGILAAHGFLLP